MDKHASRLKSMLKATIEGALIGNASEIAYDEAGLVFSIGDSGIEIALEDSPSGARWRVRELYEVADVEEGGHHNVGATVILVHVGDEMIAAKAAVMRMIERRIDAVIDSIS